MGQDTTLEALRQALVDDLESITKNNGYQTTVNQVYEKPVSDTILAPTIAFKSISGSDSGESDLSGGSRDVTDTFDLMVRANSLSQLTKLLGDMRKAVTREDSNLNEACGEEISFDFSADFSDQHSSGGLVNAEVSVEIAYTLVTN